MALDLKYAQFFFSFKENNSEKSDLKKFRNRLYMFLL